MPEKEASSKRKSSPRANLTLFGQWFYFVLEYLNTTREEIAGRTGITLSSISRATRDYKTAGTIAPTRASVEKILSAFEAIAKEKDVPWGEPLSKRIMHAAGYATDEEIATSREILNILRTKQ